MAPGASCALYHLRCSVDTVKPRHRIPSSSSAGFAMLRAARMLLAMRPVSSRPVRTRILLLAALAVAAGRPRAATAGPVTLRAGSSSVERPNAVVLEIFGKGGLYSVGYDHAIRRWIGAGGAFSYLRLDGQELISLHPYINLYPLAGARSALLLQVGARLAHAFLPGDRELGWEGASATDLSAQLSVGYEHRARFLLRVLFTSNIGKNGYSPWGGLSLGWTF